MHTHTQIYTQKNIHIYSGTYPKTTIFKGYVTLAVGIKGGKHGIFKGDTLYHNIGDIPTGKAAKLSHNHGIQTTVHNAIVLRLAIVAALQGHA